MFEFIKFFVLMIYLCGCCSIHWPGFSSAEKADFFLDISKYMSKPYMWARSSFSRLYTPFTLGKFGQFDSIYTEIAYRNMLFEVLLSVAPTTIAMGELAALPRLLSYSLRGEPFHAIKGELKDKKTNKREFTLFNMNICFLPGELPLFFGGVAPAAERVSGIASLILNQNPDVICLYEVHEVNSAYALYQKLKKDYAYFYLDIGPSFLEMNSGLFVASKYKVVDPLFKPFYYLGMQNQINKGYFSFKIVDEDKTIAQIYTTHLQPYRKNVDEEIRKAELNEIIENIHLNYTTEVSYPIVLCGDLNIPWGSEEYDLSGISKHFFDAYNDKTVVNEDKTGVVDPSNRTYSACLGGERWKTGDDPSISCSEIIDYALIFDKEPPSSIQTHKVEVVNNQDLNGALSDHDGLLSIIKAE